VAKLGVVKSRIGELAKIVRVSEDTKPKREKAIKVSKKTW